MLNKLQMSSVTLGYRNMWYKFESSSQISLPHTHTQTHMRVWASPVLLSGGHWHGSLISQTVIESDRNRDLLSYGRFAVSQTCASRAAAHVTSQRLSEAPSHDATSLPILRPTEPASGRGREGCWSWAEVGSDCPFSLLPSNLSVGHWDWDCADYTRFEGFEVKNGQWDVRSGECITVYCRSRPDFESWVVVRGLYEPKEIGPISIGLIFVSLILYRRCPHLDFMF